MFKEFLSDTVISFREKIETYSKDNKVIIIEFWYHKASFMQILFNLNDDDVWLKFQNNIQEK